MEAPTQPSRPEPLTLRVLGGRPVPEKLAKGWHSYTNLPLGAHAAIWSILAPLLADPGDSENATRFKAFCSAHAISTESAAESLEALSSLLQHASALDLPADAFREDLEALSEGGPGSGSPDAIVAVMAEYAPAIFELQMVALQKSIADHGNLLTGIDWRVDQISVSDRGPGHDASVLILTLRYRQGTKEDRVTLQLPAPMISRLRDVLSQFRI